MRHAAAGRTINKIDTKLFQLRASAIDCSKSQPPSIQSVAEMPTNNGAPFGQEAHGLRDLAQHARAIFKRAAVIVVAVITERREKFMNEITMRGVISITRKPASHARRAAVAKAVTISRMPLRVSACGIG